MKPILIITYYWPPSGGSGVQRWLKFVKYLPKLGYQPIVLTVDPSFAAYSIIDKSLLEEINRDAIVVCSKSKDPFKWYKKITRKKDIPQAGFAGQKSVGILEKVMRFIRGNFFIPDARKGWNKYAYKEAKKLIYQYNIETVITTSPPHSTQLIGLRLKKEFDLKWISDLRDPWTDIYYYNDLLHTSFAKKKDLRYEKETLEYADEVIVVSLAIKKMLSDKYPNLSSNKFLVIPNGYDATDFKAASKTNNHSLEKFTISYVGNMSENYPMQSFLSVFNELRIDPIGNILFDLTGSVNGFVDKYFKSNNMEESFLFNGYLPHSKALEKLTECNVLLLIIPNVKDNKGILTGKLFEYLAAQKPILCLGPVDGDASEIIDECDSGKTFDYEDEKGIKTFLLEVLKNPKSYAFNNEEKIKKYSRESLTKTLVTVINN